MHYLSLFHHTLIFEIYLPEEMSILLLFKVCFHPHQLLMLLFGHYQCWGLYFVVNTDVIRFPAVSYAWNLL